MSDFFLGQFYQNTDSLDLWKCLVILDNKAYFKKLDETKGLLVGELLPEDYKFRLKWELKPARYIPQKYFHALEEK